MKSGLRKAPKNSQKWLFFLPKSTLGPKIPPEVLIELKTCNTICGTHVHTILNHKDLTGSTLDSWGQGRSNYGPKLPHIAPYCSVFCIKRVTVTLTQGESAVNSSRLRLIRIPLFSKKGARNMLEFSANMYNAAVAMKRDL